jgi:hypothetical protein
MLLGADCDPNEAIRTKFDHEHEQVRRDNLVAAGYLYDENDELPGADTAVVAYLASTSDVETELLLEYQGHQFYSFMQPLTALPLALKPPSDESMIWLLLRTGLNYKLLYSAIVWMDPNVIVLPVYTWRLTYSDGQYQYGPPPSAGETAMKFAFDRWDGNRIPDGVNEHVARQRVDSLWTQCDIQFRHAGHFDVEVPKCFTSTVSPSDDAGISCFRCPAEAGDDCELGRTCGCKPNGGANCTPAHYMSQQGRFVPDAINIYFVGSFSAEYEMTTPTLGITCPGKPWIFINNARMHEDTARSLLAHEIGHVLLDTSQHEPGTLMEGGNHLLDTLTPEQCQRARNTNLEVLATALGGQ